MRQGPFTCGGCGEFFTSYSYYVNHGRTVNEVCSPEKRMWSKINKNGPNGCWLWTAAVNSWGYGAFSIGGRRMVAVHRYIYQKHIGRVLTPKQFCLHKCDTPRCVNPDHLYVGDGNQNMADKLARGRQARGERIHFAKTTEEQVRYIKANYRKTHKTRGNGSAIARQLGVSPGIVHAIGRGRSWKHVK